MLFPGANQLPPAYCEANHDLTYGKSQIELSREVVGGTQFT